MYGVPDTATRHRLKGDIRVRMELKNVKGEKKKMTDVRLLSSAPKFRARDRKLSSRRGERLCRRLAGAGYKDGRGYKEALFKAMRSLCGQY